MGHIELFFNLFVFFGGLLVGPMMLHAVMNGYRKVHPKVLIVLIVCLGVLVERGTTSANSMGFTVLLALMVYGLIGLCVRITLMERFLAWWHRKNPEYE
jgi:hypothetical protein